MSFRYKVDMMPQELNSCLYNWPVVELALLYIVSPQSPEPIDNVKQGLTVPSFSIRGMLIQLLLYSSKLFCSHC